MDAQESESSSGGPEVPRPRRRVGDPAVGVGVVLVGCLLSFYVIGLLVIPVGAWIWRRALPD
jgi:hypothetical protein